ncbi:MAG: MTH1187 family thiamine-binding protein [Methylocystaceae bacterium]
MPNCNLSLKIIPMVAKEQLYPVVDDVIRMIAASGLKYVVGPCETSVEGDIDQLLALVKKAQEVCLSQGAERVISMITLDYSPDGVSMDEKMAPYR